MALVTVFPIELAPQGRERGVTCPVTPIREKSVDASATSTADQHDDSQQGNQEEQRVNRDSSK